MDTTRNDDKNRMPGDEALNELIDGLSDLNINVRQKAIMQVMNKGPRELMAVEEALKRLTGKADIKYFAPAAVPSLSADKAYDELLMMAEENRLLDDLTLTQSLFAAVDRAFRGSKIAGDLYHMVDPKTMAVFQLLAAQLALARRNPR
jgi:hypothetical protein